MPPDFMLICVCVFPPEYQLLENRTLVLSLEHVVGTGGLRNIEGGGKTTHMQGGRNMGTGEPSPAPFPPLW